MKFRTKIKIDPLKRLFNYRTKFVSFGSCFAAEIGDQMHRLKFNITVNPFGIIYNSDSIHHLLDLSLNERPINADDLIESQNQWHHFQFHGSISNQSKKALINQILTIQSATKRKLEEADVVILTLGTAFVFSRKVNNKIVANCHKIPSGEFSREIMAVESVLANLQDSIQLLCSHRPGAEVILTVSPIRHIRDGLVENQRSKAVLLQAIHTIIDEYPGVHYFPAYEIMLDDLRDYRFYKSDLVHPNEMALEYIWERWQEFSLDDKSQLLTNQVGKIRKAAEHRFLHDNPEQQRIFAKNQLAAIDQIIDKAPHLDFSDEKRYFGGLAQ